MPAEGFVKAVWNGPFAAEMPGVVGFVHPGDVVELREDQLSGHFSLAEGDADAAQLDPAAAPADDPTGGPMAIAGPSDQSTDAVPADIGDGTL